MKKILVVEDEWIVSLHIQSILQSLGYEVVDLVDSKDMALLKVSQFKPDLVLMDIKLKGELIGLDLAKEIYAQYNIPVIYLTAYHDEKILHLASQTNAFGYILKPFKDQELYINIEIALKKSEQEKKLINQAFYDDLTQLANRVLFTDQLKKYFQLAKANPHNCFAVFFIDLNGFKKINDTYGHAMGDRVLIKVADILRSCVRSNDLVARFGGDEFGIILTNISKIEEAEKIANRILDYHHQITQIDGTQVSISASIGIAFYCNDYLDDSQLVRHADQAMYRAKTSPKGSYHIYPTQSKLGRIIDPLHPTNDSLHNIHTCNCLPQE